MPGTRVYDQRERKKIQKNMRESHRNEKPLSILPLKPLISSEYGEVRKHTKHSIIVQNKILYLTHTCIYL